jgi:hypothetical protein
MIAPPPDRIEGFPEALPVGERLLWQGRPDRALLARHVFHSRKVALYFGVLLALRAAWLAVAGVSDGSVWAGLLVVLVPAAFAVGASWLLAHLTAQTTVYAVTEKRVAMRVGIVVPFFFNIPLTRVEGVALKRFGDGSGEVAVSLVGDTRLAWLHLWPHVRPWRVAKSEPAMRGIADAEQVGRLLAVAARSVAVDGTVPRTTTAKELSRPGSVVVAPSLATASARVAPPRG